MTHCLKMLAKSKPVKHSVLIYTLCIREFNNFIFIPVILSPYLSQEWLSRIWIKNDKNMMFKTRISFAKRKKHLPFLYENWINVSNYQAYYFRWLLSRGIWRFTVIENYIETFPKYRRGNLFLNRTYFLKCIFG